MSKIIKRALCLSAVLIVFGGTTTLVGIALGGRTSINHLGVSFGRDYEVETIGVNRQKEYSELTSFNSIKAEIDALDFHVQTADKFAIDIDNRSKGKVEYEVKGGTLIVKHDYPSETINSSRGEITIYIPDEVVVQRLKLDNGVGETTIENIEIEETELNLGVGEVQLGDVTTDKLIINGGVGSILAQGLVSYDTYVNVGVGEVSLQGSFLGDVDIAGGLGVVELVTTEDYRDYNYYVTKGLGDIEINDEYYGPFKNVDEDNGAPYTMTIEGGIGSIEVRTN